ncbi:hypothetical protein NX059_002735 [Plenodomus lindquistii]|nr:hypothetical protein NX059_002735 [Plenodomus lindquistii]
MPKGGPLNFSIVESISILPNWFRNRDVAYRFITNGILAGIHFFILDEYRKLDLANNAKCIRAREHISEDYRRLMRKTDPSWTKAKHRAPPGWNKSSLSVDHIVPEGVGENGWVHPLPIPFMKLADNLKKLPEGTNSGDLTRALRFALDEQKDHATGNAVDLLFPDDLHVILDRIGRTPILLEHTDPYIIAWYDDWLVGW